MENEIMEVCNNGLSIIDTIDNSGIQVTMQKIAKFQTLVQSALKKGHDYDTIPGTPKPTLLKPGGEKICMLMGVNPEYEFIDKTEDYTNGFFSYNVRCTLMRNGNPVAQGVGNCNSKEKKYRYITVDLDKIPFGIDPAVCEKTTNSYGKEKYRIENPNIYDVVNTILKMSKKRAFIDAVLQLAALSDIFTQDIEDMKDYIEKENTDNMTAENAGSIVLHFGKHKGKTLSELYATEPGYVKWYEENGKDQVILKALSLLSVAEDETFESKADKTPKNNPPKVSGETQYIPTGEESPIPEFSENDAPPR
jgi:hypothetical protein